MKRSSDLAAWSWAFTCLAAAAMCFGQSDVWSACAIALAAINRVGSIILREMGR